MRLNFQYDDSAVTLEVEPASSGWRVVLPDGSSHHITARFLPDNVLEVSDDCGMGCSTYRIPFATRDREIEIAVSGQTFAFRPTESTRSVPSARVASGSLVAPMAGTVIDVKVGEGDTVAAYQPLAVLEAMKVMATLDAPFAGVVGKIYVAVNQQVAHGAAIIDIVPLAAPEESHVTP